MSFPLRIALSDPESKAGNRFAAVSLGFQAEVIGSWSALWRREAARGASTRRSERGPPRSRSRDRRPDRGTRNRRARRDRRRRRSRGHLSPTPRAPPRATDLRQEARGSARRRRKRKRKDACGRRRSRRTRRREGPRWGPGGSRRGLPAAWSGDNPVELWTGWTGAGIGNRRGGYTAGEKSGRWSDDCCCCCCWSSKTL